MLRSVNIWIAVMMLFAGIFAGYGDAGAENTAATVSASFESGSIGKVIKASDTEWILYLANDNSNPYLPASWRSWWYVKMENLVQDAPTTITLKNSGCSYYCLPVYSYDQRKWYRFTEAEVTGNRGNKLIVRKRFDAGTVWIARFYPYTFTDLENYIQSLKGSPYIDIRIPGYSQQGKPIYLLKITDSGVSASGKKRILIHARTHPAETPPSFLIEGMIRYLLSGAREASELLSGFEFYIFPMQNVDGVIAGNYRFTPRSENLETMWKFDSDNPLNLIGEIPPEVAIIHQLAKKLMTDGGPPVSIALNLHASRTEPYVRPYFQTHFGTIAQGYSTVEASLWEKQIRFIDRLGKRYGHGMLEPPDEGGAGFTTNGYPESWWWANYRDKVMAMSMELTYGTAGYAPRWIEPDDIRYLGASLILSILDYFDYSSTPKTLQKPVEATGNGNPEYHELNPPHAADE
jgi:hypothetical protein